jgi:hypothetical protein
MIDKQDTTLPKVEQPPLGTERNVSVDSAAFYEGDEYDEYDDFGAQGSAGGGAVKQKTAKRQEQRGGSGGSGTIYSTKHVRAKEAQPKIKSKV